MLKKLVIVQAVFLFFAANLWATQNAATPSDVLKTQIAEAKKRIESIDSKELKSWIEEDKEFVLLDVREANEINAGKIESDEFLEIPRGLVEFSFTKKVKDLNKPVVVYCLKGARGALTTAALNDLGYKNVYNLKGGILQWAQEGHPVSSYFGEFEMQNFESNFK